LVDFACETSAIVARGLDGETRCFPIGLNEHRDGILRATTMPRPASETLATVERFGIELARGLDLVGLVALEMFVTKMAGAANEMAPRPHNSGTGPSTLRDQPVRAARASDLWPAAGAVDILAPSHMENLMARRPTSGALLRDPTRGCISTARRQPARRKMGHVTFCGLTDEPVQDSPATSASRSS